MQSGAGRSEVMLSLLRAWTWNIRCRVPVALSGYAIGVVVGPVGCGSLEGPDVRGPGGALHELEGLDADYFSAPVGKELGAEGSGPSESLVDNPNSIQGEFARRHVR